MNTVVSDARYQKGGQEKLQKTIIAISLAPFL